MIHMDVLTDSLTETQTYIVHYCFHSGPDYLISDSSSSPFFPFDILFIKKRNERNGNCRKNVPGLMLDIIYTFYL